MKILNYAPNTIIKIKVNTTHKIAVQNDLNLFPMIDIKIPVAEPFAKKAAQWLLEFKSDIIMLRELSMVHRRDSIIFSFQGGYKEVEVLYSKPDGSIATCKIKCDRIDISPAGNIKINNYEETNGTRPSVNNSTATTYNNNTTSTTNTSSASSQEIAKLRKELKKEKDKNSKLHIKLNQAMENKINQLSTDIEGLGSELVEKAVTLKELKKQHDKLLQDKCSKDAQLEDLRCQKSTLNKQKLKD